MDICQFLVELISKDIEAKPRSIVQRPMRLGIGTNTPDGPQSFVGRQSSTRKHHHERHQWKEKWKKREPPWSQSATDKACPPQTHVMKNAINMQRWMVTAWKANELVPSRPLATHRYLQSERIKGWNSNTSTLYNPTTFFMSLRIVCNHIFPSQSCP